MKTPSRWFLIFGAALFAVVAFNALLPLVRTQPAAAAPILTEVELAASQATLTDVDYEEMFKTAGGDHTLSVPDTTVEQDTCLHCHLEGEDKGIWTPVARWSIFGLAGVLFAFGMYRSSSTWVTRSPWQKMSDRAMDWVDERYDIKEPLEKALKKPVPLFATQWFYCLGGITALLFLVQGVTGILLAMYYKPSPETAYASIQFIENEVRLGAATRAIHHWAANGMIVMCVAHMLRVFITGAFKAPRELNWAGGVLLLIMTLGFGFTGYLLPWDQRAYWATTVGTEIAGGIPDAGPLALVFLRAGWAVTAETLSRFFAAHVLILPAMTIVLLGLHFLMIRRQGIAEPL